MLLLLALTGFGEHLLHGLQKASDRIGGGRGMEQPEGNRVVPIHRQNLQQRVNPRPLGHRHHQHIVVLAAVEGLQIVKGEIHNLNLQVISPEVVPQLVGVFAPVALHQHQLLAV